MKNKHLYSIALLIGLVATGVVFNTLRKPAPTATTPRESPRHHEDASSGVASAVAPAEKTRHGTAYTGSPFTQEQTTSAPRHSSINAHVRQAALPKGQTLEVRKLGPVEPVSLNGELATANARIGNIRYDLSPNQIGMFPRVAGIDPHQTIPVTVTYPGGSPGDQVVVEAEDGGHFANQKVVTIAGIGADKNIQFDFTAGRDAGVYRITLNKGGDTKTLDFWVGPELQVRN